MRTKVVHLLLISFQALGTVIGAAYFNQPPTSAGAFTRGSVIFAALLTTCLDAFGEVRTSSSLLSRLLFDPTDADANDWEAGFAEAGQPARLLSVSSYPHFPRPAIAFIDHLSSQWQTPWLTFHFQPYESSSTTS